MAQEKRILSAAAVLGGNFLYALTVKLFVLPANLVMGGTTGLGLTANYLTGVPLSAFVLVFNVLMLVLGWRVLGRAFAVTTLASTFLYPLALEFWQRVLGDFVLTDDILLCTVFSGLGIGVALGVVIRAGASTGGMDIPPLILNRLFRLPVSVGLYGFDVCILLSQTLFQPAEKLLYGVLFTLIYTLVLDKMLLMGTTRTEIKVVSQKSDEICAAILTQVDRGVTLLEGESGYLRQKTQIVLSIVSNRELPRVEKLIRAIDPESFLVISRVTEVKGRGFSLKKDYREEAKQ
ncbi:YitT family protein [Ruthenibacterium sp. CLA-JM-H11]|uniref:YitT family protein n=1 Tax=Ruthenibacterium intestinale TaxID=3133163 RepID=A0ABV1GD08_9FIRM